MSHHIVLGTLSSLEHALGTTWSLFRRLDDEYLTVFGEVDGSEEGSGTAGMACSEIWGGWEGNGRAGGTSLLEPPPPNSHLILIRLCSTIRFSSQLSFFCFALSSYQTSTSNLLPLLTSLT